MIHLIADIQKARRIVITWPSLIPATDHGAHAQTHSFVLVHHVSQQLGGSRYRNALFVAQLVDAALPRQKALPETAVGGSTCHGAQQVRVDLDDLLHCLRRNIRTSCCSGVHRYDDTVLKLSKNKEKGGQVILQIKTQECEKEKQWITQHLPLGLY